MPKTYIMSVNPELYFKYLQDTLLRNPKLDELESRLVICTLHNCMNKLLLIKKMLLGFKGVIYPGYTTLAMRTNTKNKIQAKETLSNGILQSHCIYIYITYILDVLEEMIPEVCFQGTCGFLQYFLCCENLKSYDEVMLKDEYKENTKILQYVKDETICYTSNAKSIQKYLLNTAGPCLDRAETNAWVQQKTLENYNRLNENAKIEQNLLQLKEKENAILSSIDKLNNYTDEDMKIHLEVDGHLSVVYTEIVEKFEYWSNRYSTEIDRLDVELLQLRSKSEEQMKSLEKKQEEVQTQGELIRQLQVESDMRDREQQQKIKENKAATIIQVWWKNKLFWKKIKLHLRTINKPDTKGKKNTKLKNKNK